MKTIQQLAKEVCDNMEYEEERKIYHMKTPGDPKWIEDMIHECHYQGMLPDDFIFEWVYAFCKEISQLNEKDDPLDIEVCSDTYSHDLLKWFSSNLARADFVNEILNDGECSHSRDNDIFLILGLAQEKEMDEVLWTVIDKLDDRLEWENENSEVK